MTIYYSQNREKTNSWDRRTESRVSSSSFNYWVEFTIRLCFSSESATFVRRPMCMQITSVVRRTPGALSTVLRIYLHLLGMTQLSLMLCYSFLLAAYRLHQADESGWPSSSSSKYFSETFPFPFIALISFVYVVFFRFLVCGIYMDQSFWFADHDQTEDYRIDNRHVL